MLINRIHAVGASVAILAFGYGMTLPAGAATRHSHTHARRGRSSHHVNNRIPQHNGGDRDADNNGGPSDGDGNA
jgi:hypothetical protein